MGTGDAKQSVSNVISAIVLVVWMRLSSMGIAGFGRNCQLSVISTASANRLEARLVLVLGDCLSGVVSQ